MGGRSPDTGTKPGYEVCNCAGEGSALANTTIEGCGTCAKRSIGDDGDVCKGFSNPFGVAVWGEAKDGKGEKLEFC